MDIVSIAASAKSARESAAVPTDGPADTPRKSRPSLSEAVNRHLMRKKWLKLWGEERSKGPVVEVLTSMVKKTKADETGMWASVIDAAIAAVPAPLPAGRQLVTVCPPYRGKNRITRDEYAAAVEAPTKEGWWFTPKTGWPKDVVYAGGRPADLMPTEEMAEPGFFLPDDALGELRVEVLECDGLPSMDFGGWDENDVYALLVFEGTVAKTRLIMDVDNPRWHCECARGFKLPIRSASSALHVALFDSDEDSALNTLSGGLASSRRLLGRELNDMGKGVLVVEGVSPGHPDDRSPGGGAAGASGSSPSKDLNGGAAGGGAAGGRTASGDTQAAKAGNVLKDDPIGRLVIEPRRLVPGTSYDSWFELRRSSVLDDAGQFGAVRLRLSNASCLPPALALTPGPDSPPHTSTLTPPAAAALLCRVGERATPAARGALAARRLRRARAAGQGRLSRPGMRLRSNPSAWREGGSLFCTAAEPALAPHAPRLASRPHRARTAPAPRHPTPHLTPHLASHPTPHLTPPLASHPTPRISPH